MVTRSLIAFMWLFVMMWAWNYAAAITGAPEALGLILGPIAALAAVLHAQARAPERRRSSSAGSRELRRDSVQA